MISGIFGKTKPINYVILLGLLSLLYGIVFFSTEGRSSDPSDWVYQIFILLLFLFSVLVIDFVVNRNQISNTNAYVALFFVILVFLFPASVRDTNAIGCNFFLVLACRRLISMRTLKNIKLKILDATLWVLASSIFFGWAAIFLFLVYIAIYIYEPKNLKNWFVPIAGAIAFLLIWKAILILSNTEGFFSKHYNFRIGEWDLLLRDWTRNTKLIIFVLVISITAMAVFLKSGKLGLGRIINLRVVSIYFLLSIIVVLLSLTSDKFPVLITFFPAAVFLGKYIEMIKRENIREMVLAGAILSAFFIFTLELLSK
ncbi:hypothetical protein SAMN06265375_101580 [Muriicola jejuensis]|uniref:Beta-carotene 15,15'-monooxygenase n=1 Tax=Muriicola jejuensis TaxID=504488 RepID=A0A6P0UDU9_9FLAO|nr:DUF6427 family protein [Muriicola jejuensis]NER09898.1 hypothetical protein [Muriicola jejuensis]SMP04994.1 hypothetical protein SAMN06265375_101580 [Muriicola jejuensis]